MTRDERIIVTGYTGVTMVNFSYFHEDVEKRLGRPVFSHTFGDKNFYENTIKPLYKDDFIKLCED